MTAERRAAFLLGEGTLTLREVRDWAAEQSPRSGLPLLLDGGVPLDTPLMVSVLSEAVEGNRDRPTIAIELSRPAACFLKGTVAHLNQRKILPVDRAAALETSAWLEEIEAATTAALDGAA